MNETKNYEMIIRFFTKFKNVNIFEVFNQKYSTFENNFVAIEMKFVVLTNFSFKKKISNFFFFFLIFLIFLKKKKKKKKFIKYRIL